MKKNKEIFNLSVIEVRVYIGSALDEAGVKQVLKAFRECPMEVHDLKIMDGYIDFKILINPAIPVSNEDSQFDACLKYFDQLDNCLARNGIDIGGICGWRRRYDEENIPEWNVIYNDKYVRYLYKSLEEMQQQVGCINN